MKYLLFFILLILFLPISNGQDHIAELYKVWEKSETDRDSVIDGLEYSETLLSKNLDNAKEIILESSKIAEKTKDSIIIYEVLYFDALHSRNSKKHQEALRMLEKYIEFHSSKGSSSSKFKGIRTAGALYAREGEFEKSEDYLTQAQVYYKKEKNLKREALTLKALGSLNRRRGDSGKALEFYQNALDIFKSIKDESSIATTHNTMGILYYGVGDIEKSEFHLLKSLGFAIAQKNRIREARGLSNLGAIVSGKEKKEKYFLKAIEIYRELGMEIEIAKTSFNLGEFYTRSGNFKDGLKYYEESKLLYDKSGFKPDPQLKLSIAYLYSMTGRKNDAAKMVDEIEPEIQAMPVLAQKIESYNVMANLQRNIGNWEAAWTYLTDQGILKDSLINIKQAQEISKLETEYGVKQKDQEIKTLKIEDVLKQERIQNQRLFIGGSIAILGALSLLFYRLFLQKKKIHIQNKEKEVLLKEIHHRVKNNLQVISSLLGIQSRSISDPKAKVAIMESKSRVHSMSLIHQNLYNKENLSGVEMQDYITKLCNNLIGTYQIGSGNIELKTEVDDLKLDVETVIPIGLIVNELITNSLKYAFPNSKDGEILVSLQEINEQLVLEVADNGIGLSAEQTNKKKEAFGHQLIRAFKQKLKAEIEIDGNEGTAVTISIKNYRRIDS